MSLFLQFAGIALDGVIGLMLVIVSTPLYSCPPHSRSMCHQHFLQLPGPRTRLRNLLITQGMHNTDHLLQPLTQLMSGIIYFPLMFLLKSGAAIVSSVGLVSIVLFQWLSSQKNYVYCFTAHSADMMPWSSLPLSQSQTSWCVQSVQLVKCIYLIPPSLGMSIVCTSHS